VFACVFDWFRRSRVRKGMTSAWFDFISVSRILSFDVNKLIVNNENELICCLYEESIFVCCEMIGVRFDVSWSKLGTRF